jgi:hypothetical protein
VTACPGSPQGHQTFGGSVCALCGQSPAPSDSIQVLQAPEAPEAFRRGEQAAYDRVLALLVPLQQVMATRSRDEGRGAAHALQEIATAVRALQADALGMSR